MTPAINPKAYADVIKKLPPLMKAVMTNGSMTATCMLLADVFGLTPTQNKAMMGIINSLVAQEYPPRDVLAHVQKDVKLPADKSKLLARELLGRVALPMAWFIGSVDQALGDVGGDPAEYEAALPELYPELSQDKDIRVPAGTGELPTDLGSRQSLLDNFDDRLMTFRGRAEILLRLTGLSAQLDEMMQQGKIPAGDGQELMQQLDAITYPINTQDLNLFEIQAIKRRLVHVVERFNKLTA